MIRLNSIAMTFDQHEFDIRCEWGEQGVAALAPISDVVVIVDVLSFSTCVEIATRRNATVFPYGWRDQSAEVFAAMKERHRAVHFTEWMEGMSYEEWLAERP